MRRRVHLHGHYADYHDGPIEVEGSTVWDAVEAVTSQVKGFKPDPHTGRKVIQVVGYPTIESLKAANDNCEDIHIIPHLGFGKKRGMIQTIIGVTLIIVGAFMGGGFWNVLIINIGVSLLIGGVIQMMSPQPQLNTNNEQQERSKYLGGTANTVRIGTTIGVIYGKFRAGGQILSLNIDAKDVGL